MTSMAPRPVGVLAARRFRPRSGRANRFHYQALSQRKHQCPGLPIPTLFLQSCGWQPRAPAFCKSSKLIAWIVDTQISPSDQARGASCLQVTSPLEYRFIFET